MTQTFVCVIVARAFMQCVEEPVHDTLSFPGAEELGPAMRVALVCQLQYSTQGDSNKKCVIGMNIIKPPL